MEGTAPLLALPSLGLSFSAAAGVTGYEGGTATPRRSAATPRRCHEAAGSRSPKVVSSTGPALPRKAGRSQAELPPQGPPRDLGLPHRGRLVRVLGETGTEQLGAAVDLRASLAEAEFAAATETFGHQLEAVLGALGEHLRRLPPGSLAVEFGSRFGDFAARVAGAFPDVQVQPTEGAGKTLGIFLLLQERVTKHNEDLRCAHGQAGPQLLPPRYFDGARQDGWVNEMKLPSVGCVFAVNVLQFVGGDAVEGMLRGCRRVLRKGGLIFLAGPFFDGGEVSDSNLVYHAAIHAHAKSAASMYPDRTLLWGLHDLQDIRSLGAKLGMEVAEHRKLGPDWDVLVLRRPNLHQRRTSLLMRATVSSAAKKQLAPGMA